VSNNDEDSRRVDAREGTRPEISAVDNADASEELEGSQQTGSVKSANEDGNVTAGEAEVLGKPEGISSSTVNEVEAARSRPDILLGDATENNKETAGSRPVSVAEHAAEDRTRPVGASQPVSEEENVEAGKSELAEDIAGSPPIKADELGADVSISGSSQVSSLHNPVVVAEVVPVSVTESSREVATRPLSATDPNNEPEARPVSSLVDDVDVSEGSARSSRVTADEPSERDDNPLTSDADTRMKVEGPIGTTVSASNSNSVAGDDVSEKPMGYLPVSDSAEEEGNRSVGAENRTEDGESKTVSVSEFVRMEGTESVTAESMDVSEDRLEIQSISLAYTTDGEESLSDSVAVSTKKVTSPPTSSAQEEAEEEEAVAEQGRSGMPATEGNIPAGTVESIEQGSTSHSAVATTEVDQIASANTAESPREPEEVVPLGAADRHRTEPEGDRPVSSAGAVTGDGNRPYAASEPTNDQTSNLVNAEDSANDEEVKSAKEEVSKSAKEEGSKSAAAAGLVEQEERPGSAVESAKVESRLVSTSDSSRGESSEPASVASEGAGLTEALHSVEGSVGVSGSLTEQGRATGSDYPAELVATKAEIAVESVTEESRPVSAVTGRESSSATLAESETRNESTEVTAESTEVVQTARSAIVPTGTEEDTVNTTSRPSSSVSLTAGTGADPGDRTSTSAAGNVRPSAESRSVAAEASELVGPSSSAAKGTRESMEWAQRSVNAQNDAVPSVTGTEATAVPGSGLEQTSATGSMEERSAEDVSKELNTAATTIQATFRGYQTRQALSKAAENDEVRIGHGACLLLL
jgi:hypothetical protein